MDDLIQLSEREIGLGKGAESITIGILGGREVASRHSLRIRMIETWLRSLDRGSCGVFAVLGNTLTRKKALSLMEC